MNAGPTGPGDHRDAPLRTIGTRVQLIDAEVLRVGPDEKLIVRIPQDALPQDDPGIQSEIVNGLVDAFNHIGLGSRVLVLVMDGVEFTTVAPDSSEFDLAKTLKQIREQRDDSE